MTLKELHKRVKKSPKISFDEFVKALYVARKDVGEYLKQAKEQHRSKYDFEYFESEYMADTYSMIENVTHDEYVIQRSKTAYLVADKFIEMMQSEGYEFNIITTSRNMQFYDILQADIDVWKKTATTKKVVLHNHLRRFKASVSKIEKIVNKKKPKPSL